MSGGAKRRHSSFWVYVLSKTNIAIAKLELQRFALKPKRRRVATRRLLGFVQEQLTRLTIIEI
ncbi:hypothetical protein B9G53_17490 [Pseudanabaena sp. SR411]|nr:hypothetical protein B9G53_17490 [Pseudanabaena sp. SR411]